MSVTNAQAAEFVQGYLDAFCQKDLEKCLGFYLIGAEMSFGPVHLRGNEDLTRWHKARFDANASVVHVEAVSADGDVVKVEGKMTSNRLKTWRIQTISGVAEFTLHQGKISEARFRMNPKSVVPAPATATG